MDPSSSATFAGGWLALATGPHGGAFVIGLLLGALIAIYLWQKFVVLPQREVHEKNCQARLDMLQAELNIIKPVAERWEKFMEKKAFELLDMDRVG